MLSQMLVFRKSKNFTSSNGILMPPTVPINHYGDPRNQQNRTARHILLFHANVFTQMPPLNTLIFSRENSWFHYTPNKGHAASPGGKTQPDSTYRKADHPARPEV